MLLDVDCPLSELQRALLADVFHGVKMLDIAENRGFSRSALYREFDFICDQLCVDGRSRAVAYAIEKRWI